MKRLVVLGLLVAGCATQPPPAPVSTPTPTPAAVTTPAGWSVFHSPDGRLSMLVPGPVDVMDNEDGFELNSHTGNGPQVEIDYEKFATPKLATQRHGEKVKDAKAGGKCRSEKRTGDRVVLELLDAHGTPFANVLLLAGDHVIDVMVTGAPDDVARLVDSITTN